jgi:hypothetical protein
MQYKLSKGMAGSFHCCLFFVTCNWVSAVKDCVPGNTMRKLMERLSLTFHVCINRDQPVRLKGSVNSCT